MTGTGSPALVALPVMVYQTSAPARHPVPV